MVTQVALAAVFIISAVAKARNVRRTAETITLLGVPQRWSTAVAIGLPTAELVAAALLISPFASPAGGVAAFALLTLFTVVVGRQLAKGRRPDCGCFGAFGPDRIGPSTLLRNGVLMAMAAFVALAALKRSSETTLASPSRWLAEQPIERLAAGVVGLVVLAVIGWLAWLCSELLRQQGRLLIRLEHLEHQILGVTTGVEAGLPVGAPTPNSPVYGLDGRFVRLDEVENGGRSVLLLFTDPHCGPCNTILPDIAVWQRDYADALMVTVLVAGSSDFTWPAISEHGIENVFLIRESPVMTDYHVLGTPSGLLVDKDGTVAAPVATGVPQLRDLVSVTVANLGGSVVSAGSQ